MKKSKFEYIWLDGYTPEPSLRGKTKIISLKGAEYLNNNIPSLEELPEWSFDGSSTQQAEGSFSDCLLKPVRIYPNPLDADGFLVFCEVYNPDGKPHPTNLRHLLPDTNDLWIGFEQEYVLMKNGKPLGFPESNEPRPQGPYYCAVGNDNVQGRDLVEEHLDLCLQAGLDITGINAEVMLGQWEFQVFAKNAKQAADDCWIARYLLLRLTEIYDVEMTLHPKPIKGDWNGSGMHTNFSNEAMRKGGNQDLFEKICEKFAELHDEHIKVYGSANELRLTGKHETQNIKLFSYGKSDRGASIRIPPNTISLGWKGYLEDRRPASNANPYRIALRILETLNFCTD